MTKIVPLILASGLLALASSQAQLAHRYSFNDGTGNDSVGTANGTGLTGAATISGGLLTTTGANADHLTLPSSVGTGITGNFSIQFYASTTTLADQFSTVFSFGSDQQNFLLFNANRPSNLGTSANFQQNNTGEVGIGRNGNNVFSAANLQTNVVLTYNSSTGVANIYNNGNLFATGNAGTGFNLQTITAGTNNGLGGNAPYNDPSFSGSIDDFRIFSSALTQTQVTSLNTLGVNATNAQIAAALVPEPSAWTAALAGAATLFGLQRFRRRAA